MSSLAFGSQSCSNPQSGMLAIVRKRRGIISNVKEFDGDTGRLHLVRVEYKDDHRPDSEELIWELEPSKKLLEPNELPQPSDPPMQANDFDAMVRAARWTAITPYIDPDGEGPLDRLPACSPFHGAVQVENFQLIPLLKALSMPRINLLIADDVGLGKTVEAGLILSEMIIRRRINRVLIMTPASLRIQWQDEMWSKFSLPFDTIDRDSTMKMKRSLGIDANPWRCCSRIITSYHYLRQPDVLEQFISASRTPENSPHLPWDLLIVDEVHNLMPSPFGEDSQLCRMLRVIAPLFEHRLFLTATPHNGHTRSFTGLLELLDPVRFSRTDELRPAEKERVKQVVIRRLKREINERSDPPRFCTRKPPQGIALDDYFSSSEINLINAFEKFRSKVRSFISKSPKQRRQAGSFAIEILGKRMLSGPMTFLESWQRCKLGMLEDETAEDQDVVAVEKAVNEDMADDRETQKRETTAASVIGSWMKNLTDTAVNEINAIDTAAENLGVDLSQSVTSQNPDSDARYKAMSDLIDTELKHKGKWRDDERLVVFTEYKTTLDYLHRRLKEDNPNQEDRFLPLYGGMDDYLREDIKSAFNDPDAPVRILIATDAASEGLNLQSTTRRLIHYDCPWNPARLEQRNGRLDRHGQARDVYVYHFASEQEQDLKFISYLIKKVDQIREDLGSTGELFDQAIHRRFIRGEQVKDVSLIIENQIAQVLKDKKFIADDNVDSDPVTGGKIINRLLDALAEELDFDSVAARDTLEAAMAIRTGRPQLSELDNLERFDILNPSLHGWKETIDETIRKQISNQTLGPMPKLTFSPKPFIKDIGGREVFNPRNDTLMVHLGHAIMQKANGSLTRSRFPGPGAVSRWTVKYGEVPDKADALIILHLEELGVNELRETFHHWVRTIRLPVNSSMSEPLPHASALDLRDAVPCNNPADHEKARDVIDNYGLDLQDIIKKHRDGLTEKLSAQLKNDGETARAEEDRRYKSRQGEVSTLITENTIEKLEREIRQLKARSMQPELFDTEGIMADIERSLKIKQEELEHRRRHYEELREQLSRERERIMKFVLPKRFALQGKAQVFPIAMEVRLPVREGGAR